MSSQITLLNTFIYPKGYVKFVNNTDNGELVAEIDYRKPDVLYIASVNVEEDFRRNGIASHLAGTTLRGVFASGYDISSCNFSIENPAVIDLVQKLIPDTPVHFYEERVISSERTDLSADQAFKRVVEHKSIEEEYQRLGQDLPEEIDYSILARVAVNREMVSGFPLPSILIRQEPVY